MSVRNRILHGLYAGGFSQAVTIVSQLAGVPLFLYFWGVEKYGEWLILSTIPAYLALSDLGFASVAANDMTMNVARGHHTAAIKTFQSILVVIFIASIVAGAIVALGLYLELTFGFLPVGHMTDIEKVFVIIALWLQVIVAQIGGQLGAGFRCDGQYAVGALNGSLIRLAEFLSTVASLAAGGGILAVALSILAARTIGTYGMALDLRRRSPWLTFGMSLSSRVEILGLIRPALAFMHSP
jgi:hypothetical protein